MEKGTRKAFLQEFQKLVGLKSGDLIRKWYNSNVANLGTGKWAWCCATVVYCAKLSKIEVGQRHLYVDEVFHLKNILKVSYDEIFPDKCNGYEE